MQRILSMERNGIPLIVIVNTTVWKELKKKLKFYNNFFV